MVLMDKIRLVILLKIVFKPRNIEISSLILVINLRILMSGIPDPVIQVAEEVAIKNHSREMAEIMIVTGQTMVEEEGMDTEQGAVLEDIKTRQNTEVKTTEGGFSRTMIVLLQIGVRVTMVDTRNAVAEIAIKMNSEAKMEELTVVVTNGVTMLCLRVIIGGMVKIMAVEVIKKSSEISMILEATGMLESTNEMIAMVMVVIGVFNQVILLENVLMRI